jgi:hypothetical protein
VVGERGMAATALETLAPMLKDLIFVQCGEASGCMRIATMSQPGP